MPRHDDAHPGGMPRVPSLDFAASRQIIRWVDAKPEDHPLMAAGAARNAIRHALDWGPVMVAALVKAGLLEPYGDPLEALDELIREHQRAERRAKPAPAPAVGPKCEECGRQEPTDEVAGKQICVHCDKSCDCPPGPGAPGPKQCPPP